MYFRFVEVLFVLCLNDLGVFSKSQQLLPRFQARAGNFERAHGLLQGMEKVQTSQKSFDDLNDVFLMIIFYIF